jgi:hypothetical protein
VYKPGYALWNSEKGAINPYEPKNLSSNNNVVRLVNFEKAAEEWRKIADTEYEKKRPRALNFGFLSMCFDSDLDRNAISIDEVVRNYEMPLVRAEETKLRSKHENPEN